MEIKLHNYYISLDMESPSIYRIDEPQGYVVIDDINFPFSLGGVTLIKGIDLDEVKALSKSMSQKLSMLNIPISGAKAAINSDRIEDFYLFIEKIKHLINGDAGHFFISVPDIGTSNNEHDIALKRAGLDKFMRLGLLTSSSTNYFGLEMDNVVTALGSLVCAEEILRRDKTSDPLLNRKIALEGFGKVGSGVAAIIFDRAILVAISTKYGMITDPKGLDIIKLLDLKKEYGDRLIFEYGLDVHKTDELFSVSCDILIPGERTHVITESIARKIKKIRPIIIPVSNSPYTIDGLRLLEDAGLICFPDFISSAGDVIATMAELAGCKSEERVINIVRNVQQGQTRELMREGRACGVYKSMYKIACDRALQKQKYLHEYPLDDINEIADNFVNEFNLKHII